jgi:S-DNA-T family DNA segregation ATPase FtsK/SpoIIIE
MVMVNVTQKRRGTGEKSTSTKGATVSIISGQEHGKFLPLKPSGFLIGRGRGSDLQLTDIGVSRRHAMLRWEISNWIIEDLGSRLGTKVNGHYIKTVRLHTGDRILINTTEIIFRED